MKAQMQKGFTLIELMIVVAIIGILAAIAIPQYQTYVAKSQVSRVMSETGSMKTAVESCLLDGKTVDTCEFGWTYSNLIGGDDAGGDAGGDSDGGELQDGLTVTFDENAATIVATFGNNAAAAIADSELTWDRNSDGAWSCFTTVQSKYRPSGCSNSTAGSAAD